MPELWSVCSLSITWPPPVACLSSSLHWHSGTCGYAWPRRPQAAARGLRTLDKALEPRACFHRGGDDSSPLQERAWEEVEGLAICS